MTIVSYHVGLVYGANKKWEIWFERADTSKTDQTNKSV